jgi:hypothetical protein
MTVTLGTGLGPYEIQAPIGAGGTQGRTPASTTVN